MKMYEQIEAILKLTVTFAFTSSCLVKYTRPFNRSTLSPRYGVSRCSSLSILVESFLPNEKWEMACDTLIREASNECAPEWAEITRFPGTCITRKMHQIRHPKKPRWLYFYIFKTQTITKGKMTSVCRFQLEVNDLEKWLDFPWDAWVPNYTKLNSNPRTTKPVSITIATISHNTQLQATSS